MYNNEPSSHPHRVSVVGLGKLGAPFAACAASKGHSVTGVDLNARTIHLINNGHTPVFEPGLEELVRANHERLFATDDYDAAVKGSEITFIIVPTPSDERGGFSLRHVFAACERIGQALRTKPGYHLVVLTSTVSPGATDNEVKRALEAHSGKRCGEGFGLCYSPEFIALGSVIRDMFNPDFILIGESDSRAGDVLASFYRSFCDNAPPIARMNCVNAEIAKLGVNTFITTKITFANMVARICEQIPGADADVVTGAIGLDSRIGRKYIKGAIGYGGPCFPRDNLALSLLARQVGVSAKLAETTDSENRQQVSYLAELVKSKLAPGGSVGILGLAYKPNTNVVEESQGLLLAQTLLRDGFRVVAYDPQAMENAQRALSGQFRMAQSAEACVSETDVAVITTPWEEFRHIPPRALQGRGRRVLVDCWRLLNAALYDDLCEYVPLGVGKNVEPERKT